VTNPLNVNLSEDTDQDGISNADEVALGLDPYNPYNGISALDGAAFIVAWESYLGASSSTVDTDGDGWSDFDEVMVYQTNLFDERSLPGPISNLSAATTSQPVAASTPTATPSTSLIQNGDFSKTNISTWIDGKKLKGYNGSGFEWAAGSVERWSAYAGSTIEVWNTGTRVVELNGDKSNYGIQQKVEIAKPGAYLLTWRSLGRTQEAAPAKNKKTPPAPDNFYFVQVQIGEGSGGRAIKTENFTAGGDRVFVFQLSEKDLTDANGKGIYIAFIPTISSNSYGSLISGVNLVPLEVNCPELYMFGGNKNDVVELCKVSGITCEWKLKSATPAIGTFDHPADTACSFTATTKGKNTIQLIIGGKVAWEKPTEIIDIVTRAGWGAVAPKAHAQTMPDFQHVTLHHTSNTNTGAQEMQRIQKLHMGLFPYNLPLSGGKNFDDIGYHFVMDKTGVVYEGRQLEAAPGTPRGPYTKGEHVATNNTVAGIGFCTMGDYEGTEGNEPWPAARQKDLEKAVSALCRRYKIPSSKLSYHKVMALVASPSECPGSNYIQTIPDIIKHVNESLQ
jgi:hypothetical protein